MKIIIDLKLKNLNETINESRRNYYLANKSKQKEMKEIGYFLIGVKPIEKYPIKINCEWHVKNIASDIDNKILKNVLDSMQKMGILENDNIKHINEINNKAIKDDKDYLVMEII